MIKLVLKIVRKVLAGRHPEAEMTGYLTARGVCQYRTAAGRGDPHRRCGEPHTIILAQGFRA